MMVRLRLFTAGRLVLLVAPLIVGCTVRTPANLELVSVETTDYYGLPYFPPLSDWIRYEDDKEVVMREQRVLKVTFSSAYNLPEFAKVLQARMHMKAYFCDRSFDPVRLTNIFFYWRDFEVDKYDERLLREMKRLKQNRPYHYLTYIFAQRYEDPIRRPKWRPTWYPQYLSFDLRKEPEDVCFHLEGASYDFRYKSNVIEIPRTVIEEALQNEPPGLAR